MSYDTIIFDLDGTLLYTLEDLMNSVNYSLNIMGYPIRTLDEIRQFIGNGVRVLITRSIPQSTSITEMERCLCIFEDYYAMHMNDSTRVYDGILNMLEILKKMNIKTGVVSNKNDMAVKQLCKNYFSDYIDVAIGTPDYAKKPDPYSINEAITILKASKERTIYTGDSEIDFQTARNFGIKCIGVSWGFRDRSFLEKVGFDYVVDNPLEITKII